MIPYFYSKTHFHQEIRQEPRVLQQITGEELVTFRQDIWNFEWSAVLTQATTNYTREKCIVHFVDLYNKRETM